MLRFRRGWTRRGGPGHVKRDESDLRRRLLADAAIEVRERWLIIAAPGVNRSRL